MHGTQTSMTVGLVAVALSVILGVVLGGISGYVGGRTDQVIQRIIELLQSVPTIPIWLALSAALPRDWTPIQVFFAITVILSLVGWTTLGREVRGPLPRPARGGFRAGRAARRLLAHAHHPAPHGADLPQPHHRDRRRSPSR